MHPYLLELYTKYYKFRWWALAGFGLLTTGSVACFVPPVRNQVVSLYSQGKGLVVEPTPEPVPLVSFAKEEELEIVKEQVTALEAKLIQQEKELTDAKGTVLENQMQLKLAITEVAKTNDLLEKRQNEWLATLKKVGVVTPTNTSSTSSSSKSQSSPSQSLAPEPVKSGKINLNTATVAELDSLPGIGATYAQRIVSYREEKGSFKKIEDLLEVSGIGNALLDKVKDLVEV